MRVTPFRQNVRKTGERTGATVLHRGAREPHVLTDTPIRPSGKIGEQDDCLLLWAEFSSASARSLSVTPIGFPAASNTVSRSGTSCQSARLSSSLLLRSQNSTSRLRLLCAPSKRPSARSRGSSGNRSEHADHFVTVRFLFRHLFPPFGIGTISVPFPAKRKKKPRSVDTLRGAGTVPGRKSAPESGRSG